MDRKIKIFFGILFLFQLISAEKDSARIIGGANARPGQFPYQVAILKDNQPWCGGSIIDQTHIVTAAHCTENLSPLSFKVRVGTHDLSLAVGVDHVVSSIFNHPQYIGDGIYDFDVSVMKLASPISYTSAVKAIALAGATDAVVEGTVAVVSGFGAINANMVSTPALKSAAVPLWTQENCVRFEQITNRMLCAGEFHGQVSSCQGDSGGPLVVNNKLFGIVSHGPGCGRAGPAIYTSVPVLRDWINQKLKM